jgi:hypothetical protein
MARQARGCRTTRPRACRRSSARGAATTRAGTGRRSPRNCAESGACTARRTAPRPRSWITSACRPADNPRPALARRRAAELQPHRVTEKIRENARRPAVMCVHRLGSDQYKGCPDPGVLRARRVGWSGLLSIPGCQLGQYTLSSAAHGPRSRLASLAVRQWACDAEAAPTRNRRLVPREARTAAIGVVGRR